MRKITQHDWLALAFPVAVIAVVGVVTGQERGWLTGLISAGLMLGFVTWLWRRQIRNHSQDTWRARL